MSIEKPWECPDCGCMHPNPPPKGSIDCECGTVLKLVVKPMPLPSPLKLLFPNSVEDIKVINLKGLKRLDIADD